MDFLRRFMAGRYGSDQLNNAFLLLACVLMVIEWVLGWRWMSVFILALLFPYVFAQYSGALFGEPEVPPVLGAAFPPPAQRRAALPRP